VAGAASLGLPNLPLLGELAAFSAEPLPATMRFGPDLSAGRPLALPLDDRAHGTD
jgi:hypothetical protein